MPVMVEDSIEKLAKRGCGNKNSKRVRKKSAARQMTSGLRRAFQLDLTSRPMLTTNVAATIHAALPAVSLGVAPWSIVK